MSANKDRTDKGASRFSRLLNAYEASGQPLEDFLHALPEADLEAVELLETALSLGDMDSPRVDPAFRRNARIRILNRISATNRKSPAEPRPAQPTLVFALKRVLTGLAMLVGLFTLVGAGTLPMQTALPGDVLYPGKLALERIQLLGAPPTEDAILSIRFASIRLTEIQLLIVQERYEDVDTAVAAFEKNIDRAVLALADVARADGSATYPILLRLENEMGHYAGTLGELLAFVPTDTQHVLARAIEASMIWTLETN
jgi:hypothetical protein